MADDLKRGERADEEQEADLLAESGLVRNCAIIARAAGDTLLIPYDLEPGTGAWPDHTGICGLR